MSKLLEISPKFPIISKHIINFSLWYSKMISSKLDIESYFLFRYIEWNA